MHLAYIANEDGYPSVDLGMHAYLHQGFLSGLHLNHFEISR